MEKGEGKGREGKREVEARGEEREGGRERGKMGGRGKGREGKREGEAREGEREGERGEEGSRRKREEKGGEER